MNNIDVCAIVDGGNDIRCGVEEVQRVWSQGLHAYVYRYTVNGRVAMETSNHQKLFNRFMAGRTIDDVEVVSPRYRARRFRPNIFISGELEPVEYEHTDISRFTSEPVSELLPVYQITARQLLTD